MLFIIPIIFGIICAAVAPSKGRSAIGWFFIGFFFGLFGVIVLLVVDDLKKARAKEEHMEMEQRRLREQLRQEQLKTEQLRKHTQARLDIHDQELNIDTRHLGTQIEGNADQLILDSGLGLSGSVAPGEPVRSDIEIDLQRIETRCPNCETKFMVRRERDHRDFICPKCSQQFVVAQFVESSAVQKCTDCGRQIEYGEKASVSGDQTLCAQCQEKRQADDTGTQSKIEGWYYQDRDQAVGPLSLKELKQLLHTGKIDLRTSVWHESLKEWTPGGQVSDLVMGIDGD